MPDNFSVETEKFKGPLDALLDLIESRKLSVSEISLAEVTDAYVSYVESLPQLPLPETSQFVLVASTLLVIKSRSLLPSMQITVEEESNIHDLEHRLALLASTRKAAKLLRKEWGKSPLLTPRRAPQRPITFLPGTSITLLNLQNALRAIVSLLPKPVATVEAVVAPILKLEVVLQKLKTRLNNAWKTTWREMSRGASRSDTIVYFLAILELVRNGSASVSQQTLFSDIMIEAESEGTPRFG